MNLKWVFISLVSILILGVIFLAGSYTDLKQVSAINPSETTSNYLEPTITVNPHGGYTTSSNKCKYCHAVHLASGGYMLTRVNYRAEVCDYCHGDGAGAATIVVANYEGHTTWSKSQIYYGPSPNEEDGEVYVSTESDPFSCMTCHSVHGATTKTVNLADLDSSYLLINNPDSTGTTLTSENTLAEWCADCHSATYGDHTTTFTVNGESVFTHDTSRVAVTTMIINPDDDKNYGPSCPQCHSSSMFPHGQAGTGRDMLKDSFDGISLDDVCNDCHSESKLP